MKEKSGIFCPVRKNSNENYTGQKILWDTFECLVATKNKALEMIAKKVQWRERSLWPPSHHVPRNKKFLLLGLVRIEAVVNLSWPICSYVKCKMLMNIFYILFIIFS